MLPEFSSCSIDCCHLSSQEYDDMIKSALAAEEEEYQREEEEEAKGISIEVIICFF